MKKYFLAVFSVALAVSLIEVSPVFPAGVVTGTVKFGGKPPAPEKINITKDPDVCGKKPKFKENLIVGKGNGIKNAVIFIEGTGKKTSPAPAAIKFEQDTCQFKPHIQVIPLESKLDLYNNDGLMHNIHSFSIENESANFGQPGTQKVKTLGKELFKYPEIVPVRCDVHEWMGAFFIVTDNPYAALSDGNGSFKISDVPPGTYKIKVWHEALGEQIKDITVKDGENKMAFELKKK
jgi:hypothetical protein